MTVSEAVKSAVARETENCPSFESLFEGGVLWQLERCSLAEAVEIPGKDPPVFLLETTAWRADGIRSMRILFVYTQSGIELVWLSFAT